MRLYHPVFHLLMTPRAVFANHGKLEIKFTRMETDNFKPVYRKPPLPHKRPKERSSETTTESPQGTELQTKAESRYAQIHLHRFNSIRGADSEGDTSMDRTKYRSKQRLSTRASSKSTSRQGRSASSYKSTNRPSKRLLSNQKRLVPNVSAHSWIAFEMNRGKVIHGRRIHKRRQMASLTKIMNLITAIEVLETLRLDPSRIYIRVSKQAACLNGTTAFLKEGMELSLYDLMFGIMLPSGNDAAHSMAQVVGAIISQRLTIKESTVYDVEKLTDMYMRKKKPGLEFLEEMNKLAKVLGMHNSRFTNPHGLSEITNTSTAEDLAKLCSYAIKNKLFFSVVNTKEYRASYKIHFGVREESQNTIAQFEQDRFGHLVWTNTNKMLWQGWHGVKTGITPNAGPCLAACVRKIMKGEQFHVLVILLCSESMEARWKEAKQIVNWAVAENLVS